MASIPRVNRGDLISAEFVNLLLDALNGLDTRVTALESAGSTTNTNQVFIDSLEPPTGEVRVNENLTIRGRNFGFTAGRLRVFIDSVPVNNYNRPGTNDQQIIITIPPEFGAPSPPLEGRAALLTISNSITQAQRTLLLMPVVDISGFVAVTLRRTEPATPTAGSNFDLLLTLESRLSRPAQAQLVASVTGIPTTPALLTNELTPMSPRVPLSIGQTVPFVVRVPIPAGVGAASFTVGVAANVEATDRGAYSGSFTVGTQVEPNDPAITVPLPVAGDVGIPAGQGSYSNGSLSLRAGATAEMIFSVAVTQAGPYTATQEVEAGTTGWTALVFDNASFTITNEDLRNTQARAIRSVGLRISRPGAGTAGGIRLRVRRSSATASTSQVIQVQPQA